MRHIRYTYIKRSNFLRHPGAFLRSLLNTLETVGLSDEYLNIVFGRMGINDQKVIRQLASSKGFKDTLKGIEQF